MVRNKVHFLLVCSITISSIYATKVQNKPIILTMENLPLSSTIKKSLTKEIYSHGLVKTIDAKRQQLLLNVAGLHPKKCGIALSKISQFENYKTYSDIIKLSEYVEKTQMIKLGLDHLLMPFPMLLHFKIQRIDHIGNFPFIFQSGFLKGLRGSIRVGEHKKKCLFFVQAFWVGPDSKIPDKAFSFFTTVLGEKFMERLFQVSRTL